MIKKIDKDIIEITEIKRIDLGELRTRKIKIENELNKKLSDKELIEMGRFYQDEINYPLKEELEEIDKLLEKYGNNNNYAT